MSLLMKCPGCGATLKRASIKDRISFKCPQCGGSLTAVGVLRALCRDKEFVNQLWKDSFTAVLSPDKKCPCCNQAMRRTFVSGKTDSFALELDVCRSCQMVWFDPGELAHVKLSEEQLEKLPPRAREIMAEYQVKNLAAAADGRTIGYGFGEDAPDHWWKSLPGLLGLPVEMEEESIWRSIPYVTVGAALLCLLVFVLTAGNLSEAVQKYGFIPSQPFRESGATLFSSMFLHASLWHLVGNLYFLLTFGDDVELELGRIKMLWLFLLSGFSALLFHSIAGSSSTIPCVGASGFISGFIAFYAVTFPWRRLGFCYWRRFSYELSWLTLPACLLFVIWCIFQIIMAVIVADSEVGGVAYAHLGGAVPGVIWGVWRRYFCCGSCVSGSEPL